LLRLLVLGNQAQRPRSAAVRGRLHVIVTMRGGDAFSTG